MSSPAPSLSTRSLLLSSAWRRVFLAILASLGLWSLTAWAIGWW